MEFEIEKKDNEWIYTCPIDNTIGDKMLRSFLELFVMNGHLKDGVFDKVLGIVPMEAVTMGLALVRVNANGTQFELSEYGKELLSTSTVTEIIPVDHFMDGDKLLSLEL